jgi:hypothetical protein
MRSACVPEPAAGRGAAFRTIAAILAVALTAAAAVTMSALVAEEPLTARVLWLSAIGAEGGAFAAAGAALALGHFACGWSVTRRIVTAGAVAAALFLPATLAFFALKIRILDGRIEGELAEEIASGDILFSLIGAMGMFTPSGLRYLAPWPLVAVAIIAGLALGPRPPAASPDA